MDYNMCEYCEITGELEVNNKICNNCSDYIIDEEEVEADLKDLIELVYRYKSNK